MEVLERLEKCIIMKEVLVLEYIFYYFHKIICSGSGWITLG